MVDLLVLTPSAVRDLNRDVQPLLTALEDVMNADFVYQVTRIASIQAQDGLSSISEPLCLLREQLKANPCPRSPLVRLTCHMQVSTHGLLRLRR